MISIEYKTSGGSSWTTEQEAMVADAIESQSSFYIESYKLPSIVEAITSKLTVTEKSHETN